MDLEIGDKVSFKSEVGEGEVVSIPDSTDVIVMVDGFEQTYLQTEVILIDQQEREAFTKSVDGMEIIPGDRGVEEQRISKKTLLSSLSKVLTK